MRIVEVQLLARAGIREKRRLAYTVQSVDVSIEAGGRITQSCIRIDACVETACSIRAHPVGSHPGRRIRSPSRSTCCTSGSGVPAVPRPSSTRRPPVPLVPGSPVALVPRKYLRRTYLRTSLRRPCSAGPTGLRPRRRAQTAASAAATANVKKRFMTASPQCVPAYPQIVPYSA